MKLPKLTIITSHIANAPTFRANQFKTTDVISIEDITESGKVKGLKFIFDRKNVVSALLLPQATFDTLAIKF